MNPGVGRVERGVGSWSGPIASHLADLDTMGVRVTVSELGTGTTPIVHLAKLPVAGVAIDRALTRESRANAYQLAVVSALVAVAHAAGKQVCGRGAGDR